MIGPLMVNCDRPDWRHEGRDWPNRAHSRFVNAGGLRWHVQVMGDGPVLLLLHGTGGATHSWRDLAPALADSFTCVAPDLPGHGFTEAPNFKRMSLPWMAEAVAGLLQVLGHRPVLVAGHSAGAAVASRMVLDGRLDPAAIVSFNGALLPFSGSSGRWFPWAAQALFLNPLTPRLFAFGAGGRDRVRSLIEGTGSRLEPRGLDLYARLFRRPGHVAGALGMMAAWDLQALVDDLPRLAVPLVLVAGDGDKAVPPSQAETVAGKVATARVVPMPGTGHLSHEEHPADAAAILRQAARDHGALPSAA